MEHLLQQAKGILPVLALLGRADGCIVAFHVGRERSVEHLLQQPQGFLPVIALLASADGCTVAYHMGRERSVEHLLQKAKGSSQCLSSSNALMAALWHTTSDVTDL